MAKLNSLEVNNSLDSFGGLLLSVNYVISWGLPSNKIFTGLKCCLSLFTWTIYSNPSILFLTWMSPHKGLLWVFYCKILSYLYMITWYCNTSESARLVLFIILYFNLFVPEAEITAQALDIFFNKGSFKAFLWLFILRFFLNSIDG